MVAVVFLYLASEFPWERQYTPQGTVLDRACKKSHGTFLLVGTVVIGERPDLRYDDGLYFRVKISDLTRRSINGDCQVHRGYPEARHFCGDSNATCPGYLEIAKDALDIYNEEKTAPSRLLRGKITLCTCNSAVAR